MSCLKKERKPIVPLKTLDIIFRRRNLPNSQYYFSNRKHALSQKEKGRASKPFCVPRSEKLLSYIKYSDRKEKLLTKDRLSQPLYLKDNRRIAATRDISERLFIIEPPDDVRAVVEIHPEFYTVIEGRPSRNFDDVKVYINNIRCYAMNRQQIGYRKEIIMKIEQSIADEAKEHDAIADKLKQHIKNFQKFLTEDYKKACNKVSLAEKVYDELVAKNSEILSYISKLTILNNIIFKLDAVRGTLKMYRSYLLFSAPLQWRQFYDERLKDRVKSIQFETGKFVTDNDLVETMDIDAMVQAAKIELTNPLTAHMYFRYPEQMYHLFRTMELQSREYLIQLSKTDVPYRMLQERIKQLHKATKQELDYFQYYIESINNEIKREECNEAHLKHKFFRILTEPFFNTVSHPNTLKLKICIEYVYEEILGKCEEGHQTLQDPMKILEVMYEEYNAKLDALDNRVVNQARSDFYAQDLKMMQNAYKAQRELKSFKDVTNAMNKAFLPPKEYKRPVVGKFLDRKSRIVLAMASKKKEELHGGTPKIKSYKLSQEERESLLYFTEWCEGTDPSEYLGDFYKYIKPAFEWQIRKSILP